MKSIIENNKSVIKFLVIFICSYTILYVTYYWFILSAKELDVFTKIVSKQTVNLLNIIDYETNSKINSNNDFINLVVRGKNIAGISEGCNAISIMILFISFVISFSVNIKKTVLFLIIGILIIHTMNILRIVILIIFMYNFPKYSTPLHDYVFPAAIYGVVFLLWMYWVNTLDKTKNEY